MPKRILRPLLAVVLLMSAACSTLNPTGESVAQVTYTGAPQIKIVSPLPNARYQEGVDVYIMARVENAGPDIGSVVVRLGDEVIVQATKPDASGSSAFTIKTQWTAVRSGNQVISVSVQRADPSISDLKTIDIEVLGPLTPSPTATVLQLPTAVNVQPTVDPATLPVNPQPTTDTSGQPAVPPTAAEPPTQAPTATSSVPQVKVKAGANVRKGPSTAFEPPLGSMAAGQTADIIGKSPDSSWYKIRFYNGEGWIAAITVDIQGDVSSLPVDAGPPTPIPASPVPTAVPATTAPTTGPDLVVDGTPVVSPFPFVCNKASEILITIKNIGPAASNVSTVLIQDIFNGAAGANTKAPVGALQPGQTTQVDVYLTVATNYNQGHIMRITVDADAQNTETNEGNNQYNSITYPLDQGNCP